MKKIFLAVPVFAVMFFCASAAISQDKAKTADVPAQKQEQSKSASVQPAAVNVAAQPSVSATAPVDVQKQQQAQPAVQSAKPEASQPAAAVPAEVSVSKAIVQDDAGNVFVIKEMTVDTVKKFEAPEVEKMKQEAAAEIKQIEGYVAQYNKPEATSKDKKTALKGIQELIGKRADAYFAKFQERIDVLDGISKQAKEELKAEKKNKKDFITSEAQAIVDGTAPMFRVPEVQK